MMASQPIKKQGAMIDFAITDTEYFPRSEPSSMPDSLIRIAVTGTYIGSSGPMDSCAESAGSNDPL
jgi:hypothetical protein